MELFFSEELYMDGPGGASRHPAGGYLSLGQDEAAHCIRVLRHRSGDPIKVIDGRGTLYHCVLDTVGTYMNDKVKAKILSAEEDWGRHPYFLTLAVCPTKNIDRYEWMVEKATEMGVDEIVPVIGERSERRKLKAERLRRILLSAAKQSLKAAIPELAAPISVKEFAEGSAPVTEQEAASGKRAPGPSLSADRQAGTCTQPPAGRTPGDKELKLIAYCSGELQPRASVMDLLQDFLRKAENPDPSGSSVTDGVKPRITVLIGPEGDFSPAEVRTALEAGFIPVHLGPSRLRTETAGLASAAAVYLASLLAGHDKAYSSGKDGKPMQEDNNGKLTCNEL